MKSRITIELSEDNKPVIRVEYSESRDVRDTLVKKFLDSFGHASNWCRYDTFYYGADGSKWIELYPITSEQIEEEAKTMTAWNNYNKL